VSKHPQHTPKHRNAPSRAFSTEAPKRAIRTTVILSSVAVAATGVAVSTGVLAQSAGMTGVAQNIGAGLAPLAGAPAAASQTEPPSRSQVVSRSDSREAADPAKEAALAPDDGPAMTRTEDLSDEAPQVVAKGLLPGPVLVPGLPVDA
jgi:hypothetical protein